MAYISVKKANCKNCYKCLKYCDVKSIRYIDDRVEVIEDQCILCGHCINICPQQAKTVVNDPTVVLEMLSDPGVRVVASLAPSYIGVYGRDARDKVVSSLYRMGFDAVEETAIGAHEVSAAYKELMDAGEMPVILTTCCPTVNSLITKYYPDLIPMMAPVVSPVLAHGRMIKQRDGQDTKVVFIGPCLSKIKEIHDHPESADAVLSFRQLDKLMAAQEDGEAAVVPMTAESPFSRIYPVPEGIVRDVGKLSQGMEKSADGTYNGYRFMSVCGVQNVQTFLEELRHGNCGKLFVELNACEGGCVNGPLISQDKRAAYRGRIEVETYAQTAGPAAPAPQVPALDWEFVSEEQRQDIPDEATIRHILTEIGKPTPDKELNCGSCGYPTCRDKAIAVYQGKAELYMCLPYINDLSQSLSSVTLSITPNLILAVDRDMRIIEINLAALKRFGVSRQQALKADLFEFMDPSDFQEVMVTRRNIVEKKVRLAQLDMVALQTLMYVESQDIVVGIIKDITEEEKRKEAVRQARLQSAEMAQKVIEKQMTVAQEIASLLGETTAETKVTLNTLKAQIMNEDNPSE